MGNSRMDQRNKLTQFLNGKCAVGIQEAIVPYLHKSLWKHMLKKSPDKFHRLKSSSLPCFPLTVFVRKPDDIILNAFNAVIGDGYTEDIPGEISQGVLPPAC